MKTLKQTLSDNSLGILERMVLSKIFRIRKRKGKIPYHSKKYHANFIYCETTRDQLLDALYLCETSYQEEITQ